jgi:hypothetical protein
MESPIQYLHIFSIKQQKLLFKSQSNLYGNYYYHSCITPDEIEDRKKEDVYHQILGRNNSRIHSRGGRSQCLKILKNIMKYQDYPSKKDYPAYVIII